MKVEILEKGVKTHQWWWSQHHLCKWMILPFICCVAVAKVFILIHMWVDQKLTKCQIGFTTKCRMSVSERNWYQKKTTLKKTESTIHLKQGPDFHSKKGFKWNFILENKNIGTIESKIYGGKKLFYLTFNQICLRCFYRQSLRMSKVWATVHFLDYFSFMFHPWLVWFS